jgi:hypothetical protein
MLVAFIAVSSLEIPIVSLIVPWAAVRVVLLVVGGWGVAWMLGLLAAVRVHPHVVAGAGLRLRSGFLADIAVPWKQIDEVRSPRSSSEPKLRAQHGDAGASLALHRTTNVEVTLHTPVEVRFIDGRSANVDVLRLYADAPAELVATARRWRERAAAGQASVSGRAGEQYPPAIV